ncbi:hypothetical protein FACS18948_6760 [Clostridia bacterium]|nr:hypothetical protein FACS18948_6760 [Clostridia bacterium]
MGFMGNFAGHKALLAHQKGEYANAKTLYEQALAKGADKPAVLIGYAVLLGRLGEYEKSCEILRKAEKAKGVTAQQKGQIITHYSVAQHRLGNTARAISMLEEVFRKGKSGTLYQILGYLYIEAGDYDKALSFNQEAVDYDDEDAICLDNLAQAYYRLGGDKAAAKPWFEKALAQKPGQIDTLYFLSKYDMEEGRPQDAVEKLETALKGRLSSLNYADNDKLNEALAAAQQQADAAQP